MTIQATYENGVLRLDQPLPLKDNERVLVTVHTKTRKTRSGYGLIAWPTGQDGTDFAIDPEFGKEECP